MALVLDGDVAREVDGLRRSLQPALVERVPPHVTLVPPVNVREEEMGDALEVLRRSAASCPPLLVELGPVGTFLPRTPVVYLTCRSQPPLLDELRGALQQGPFAPPPERSEERAFVPHVTLTNRVDPTLAPAIVATLAGYRNSVLAGSLTLLEQEASDRVHAWRTIADVALGGVARLARGGLELEVTVARVPDPETSRFLSAAWAEYAKSTYGADPPTPFVLTARRDAQVVAAVTGEVRSGTLELERLIVAREQRGYGIGAQLLRHLERLARDHGVRRLRLRTIAGGRAEAFYRRNGFIATTSLPDWREGRDFVVMERLVP